MGAPVRRVDRARMMSPGTLVWTDFGARIGREQGGRRPALVISTQNHTAVTALLLVLPCTTRDRGWINHVALDCPELLAPTYAMSEQPTTISVDRVFGEIGEVSHDSLHEAMSWVRRWIAI